MFNYTLYDWFDGDTDNPRNMEFDNQLKQDDEFTIDGVAYHVESVEQPVKDKSGVALLRMLRYQIPNHVTQFVHKCPGRKKMMEKMHRDDVMKLEKKVGEKQVQSWKDGRVKMQSHNMVETRCPDCKTIFWKDKNEVPETVEVNNVLNKKALRKRQ